MFQSLSDPDFVAQHRNSTRAFTRTRKLGFKFLVLFLLNQVKGALQREIDDFFVRALGFGCLASVTASAVCIARRTLRYTVFEALNRRFIAVADCAVGCRWRGLRVMAVDGSTLNLPATDELFERFGGQVQAGRKLPMLRLSQLLDVDSGLTFHACTAPLRHCERVLAADHLEHAPVDAVVLYDRGYPSFFMLAWHRLLQRQFCMRLPRGFHAGADALFTAADAPRQIVIRANTEARAVCAEHQVPAEALAVRLVRVVLCTGEVEVLATSLLDAADYPDDEFAALYALRWAVEGDYRLQKARLQLENFTGKRPHAIYQDVHARVLIKNLVQWIASMAQAALDAAATEAAKAIPTPTAMSETVVDEMAAAATATSTRLLKHRQRINLTDALHLCKHALVQILLGGNNEVLNSVLQRLQRHRHCERKGRSFPRKARRRAATLRYPMAYKPTA